jgi:hypothetical protein
MNEGMNEWAWVGVVDQFFWRGISFRIRDIDGLWMGVELREFQFANLYFLIGELAVYENE